MPPRILIKNYIKQILINAKTLAGDNIGFNTPVKIAVDKESRVLIQSLSETSEIFHDTPREYKKEFILTLELSYSNDSGNYIEDEIAFEEFIESVDKAMVANEKFNDKEVLKSLSIDGTCVSDSDFGGIEFRVEDEGKYPVYIALLKYTITYYQRTGVSDKDLTDLNTLKSDVTPSDPTEGRPSPIESEQSV